MVKKISKTTKIKIINKEAKELDSTRKLLIKEYMQLRKSEYKDEIIPRDDFVKKSSFSKRQIYSAFPTYTIFRYNAEDEYYERLPSSIKALLSERSKKFNSKATKDDCINDLRSVQELDKNSFIKRNTYREKGKYSDSTWNQYFGTFQEFRRHAGLELTRHQHKLEKSIAKHAANDHYNEYFKKEMLPYFNKYEKKSIPGNIKTIMIISDIHDIEADEFTISVFVEECRLKQPDIIVLNGDIFDLYEFSRYTQDPRNVKILERFQWVWTNVFKALRDACPNTQIDFIMGNHEFRLIRLLADATPNIRILLSEVLGLKFSDVFKVDDYQINWVSKADFSAFSKKDIEDQLKQNYRIYYNCYVCCHEPDKNLQIYSGTNGHHHRLSQTSNAYLDADSELGRQVTWVQTPAAHVRDAEYLANLSKWNTGFLEVTINIKEKQVIQNIRQTFARWTVIDGVYYERKI